MAAHNAVAECAVVGVADADKGQVPLGLVVLKDGVNLTPAALRDELVQLVRRRIGAFANFKRAVLVPRLPKTRSGKILRATIRKLVDGAALRGAVNDRRSGHLGRDQSRARRGTRRGRRQAGPSGEAPCGYPP